MNSTTCIRCYSKDRIQKISCGHSYCLKCVHFCYNENLRKCIRNCKIKIRGKIDIIPFFQLDKNKELLLYDNSLEYSERIHLLDKYFIDHKNELYNTFIRGDKRFTPLEKKDINVSLNNFMKVKNDSYLVYEIYDYKLIESIDNFSYNCLSIDKFIIYYKNSKICFIYERVCNRYDGNTNCFFLKEIIESIEKESLDKIYLNKKKSKQHLKLLQQNPERESSILNPDGYVQFPVGYEKLFCNYINRTCSWDEKKKLHLFQNYRWIHFQDMLQLEKKYKDDIKNIYFQILMKKDILYEDIVNYTLSFLIQNKI